MTGASATARLAAAPDGLLPFEPARDLRAVVDLLEIGFQDELDPRDRRWLGELAAIASRPGVGRWLLRLVPRGGGPLAGFVWYESGQLAGNISLIPQGAGALGIANVVTHPRFRRRGIGRRMVRAALDAARERGAPRVVLQVRPDNLPAIALYRQFGFARRDAVTLWQLAAPRAALRRRACPLGWHVAHWTDQDDRRARACMARAAPWVAAAGPLERALSGGGWRRRMDDWIQGRTATRLMARVGEEARALAVAERDAVGGPHRIELAIEPAWRGRFEALLVDGLLEHLADAPAREVRCDVAEADGALGDALRAAGFRPVRTLERYVLEPV